MTTYGGVHVSNNIDLGTDLTSFSRGPYIYEYRLLKNGEFDLESFSSVTIFCQSLSTGGQLLVNGREVPVDAAAQIENQPVRLKVTGEARVFVAGTSLQHSLAPSLKVLRLDEMKKVVKPWGNEVWINGEHSQYAFKRIEIKAGTKTSLQYHRFKRETNLVFNGHVRLFYKSNASAVNDSVQQTDIGSVELYSVTSIDVLPGNLHRLEALTDVLLFETSTPHLDDVIRISDDTARGHGRISAEHA